jgi:hypothetical protein
MVSDPKGLHFHGPSEGMEKDTTITPIRPPITQMIAIQNLNISGNSRWQERYDLNLCRAGKFHLFRELSIPEQGILFDRAVPIDEWKYPADGKRIHKKYARKPQS